MFSVFILFSYCYSMREIESLIVRLRFGSVRKYVIQNVLCFSQENHVNFVPLSALCFTNAIIQLHHLSLCTLNS